MVRNTAELERQFLEWGIPCVAGFELLLEMSLGRIVSAEQFANNKILDVYDLLVEDSKDTYAELMANRLAPELAKKSYSDLCYSNDYFNGVYFPVTDEECFVDCGAYDGDTIRELLKVAGQFCQVHAFEIDNINYDDLRKYVDTLPTDVQKKVKMYHAGVWNDNKIIGYGNELNSGGESFSVLKSSNVQEICVQKLDDVLKEEKVTFIKMDIEGSELPALQGAKNIIRKQKPKLAICLYHKIEDFWEIPIYLHSLVPEYQFSVMHHCGGIFYGTVLYAWCE